MMLKKYLSEAQQHTFVTLVQVGKHATTKTKNRLSHNCTELYCTVPHCTALHCTVLYQVLYFQGARCNYTVNILCTVLYSQEAVRM